jgi:hypothetical protein
MSFGVRQLAYSFLFAPLLVAACSSGDGSPVPGTSSEALLCQSNGIHIDGCPITKPGPLPNPGQLPPPSLSVCLANAYCASAPDTSFPTAGFDPAWQQVPGTAGDTLAWQQDPQFAALLATGGCMAETYYFPPEYTEPYLGGPHELVGPATATASPVWATAICPNDVVVPTADVGEILSCDPCTGTPPNDAWHVLVWSIVSPPGPPRKGIIPENCSEGACACNAEDCVQAGAVPQ